MHRLIELEILWLHPENNDIFRFNNLQSHHFTDEGCQVLKYCDMVEF